MKPPSVRDSIEAAWRAYVATFGKGAAAMKAAREKWDALMAASEPESRHMLGTAERFGFKGQIEEKRRSSPPSFSSHTIPPPRVD